MDNFVGKVCIKCNYQRQASDTGPDYACPKCQVVYWKAEEAAQKTSITQQKTEPVGTGFGNFSFGNTSVSDSKEVLRDRDNAQMVYLLFFAGFFTGFAWGASLFLARKFNNDVESTNWANSHFAWQMKAFWDSTRWSLVGLAIILVGLIVSAVRFWHAPSEMGYAVYGKIFGAVFDPFLVKAAILGVGIWLITALWQIYRMIIGFKALRSGEAMDVD